MVIATAAMLAGCGGASSTKTASTKTAITRSQSTGSGHVVTAKSGAFSTIVPQGYTYAPTAAQYVVTGSEAGEGVPTIAVVRQPSSAGDVATVARQTLRALRRPPHACSTSLGAEIVERGR